MIEHIFIDTAAFIAVMNQKDQYREEAVDRLNRILEIQSNSLLTTIHIFAETVTRIQRKISGEKAVTVGALIREKKN